MYNGHAKTIKPDKRKIVILLQEVNIRYLSQLNTSSAQHSMHVMATYIVLRYFKTSNESYCLRLFLSEICVNGVFMPDLAHIWAP